MLTLMSALALVFGVDDGTTIIIMCLPVAIGSLLIIFLRERWSDTWQPTDVVKTSYRMRLGSGGQRRGNQTGRSAESPMFCIGVDIDI